MGILHAELDIHRRTMLICVREGKAMQKQTKEKVSLRLPTPMVVRAKQLAIEEERTLTSVIQHALRLYLQAKENLGRD